MDNGVTGLFIIMKKPETAPLSAEEAQVLLTASSLWTDSEPQHDTMRILDPSAPQFSHQPIESLMGDNQSFQPQVIIDGDDRRRITNTTSFPWNTYCYLSVDFPSPVNKSGRGTGCIVGPHMVLTCAHNVYHREGGVFADSVAVTPGQKQSTAGGPVSSQYDEVNGTYFHTDPSYPTASEDDQWNYDYGAVLCYTDFRNNNISTYMPVVFSANLSENDTIYVAGYPRDVKTETNSQALWEGSGKIVEVTSMLFYYTADSTGGNSGGPIVKKNGQYDTGTIVGIHAGEGDNINGGPRLGSHNQALVTEWMQWTPPPSIEGVVFEDTFPLSSIDRTKWPVVDGAWVYNVGTNASSPPYALWMNGTPNGGNLIESKAINLSSSTYAILNYHYDKATLGDPPDPGDDLIFSYLSTHGWEEIDRQLGVGSHMRNYRLVTIQLPEDALHANFKLRIESLGDPAVGSEIYDNWFVDDVNIVAKGPGSIKVFEETFKDDLMNSPLWQKMYGVNVRGTGLNEPSPPYCLRLNGHPGNYDDVWSKEMDLSDYSRAVFSYYYARMGGYESPDAGDDLIFSYMSTHGWVELNRHFGSGPDMWSFSDQVRITLPSNALHERFMFRIQSIGTPNSYWIYDDWFVDDIVVEAWR